MTDLKRLEKRSEALKKRSRDKVRCLLLGGAGLLCFLAMWELVVKLQVIDRRLIATPGEVLTAVIVKFYDKQPDGSLLLAHIGSSLVVALSGFALAVLIGVPLGLLMGWYKPLDRFVGPVFEVIRPLPPIAWIPFAIIFLGIGLFAKSVIIFLSAFIPCVINSYTGIKLTNQVYINMAKTCGASRFRIFCRVGVPSAMPMVFAGMRISLGNSWSTLVAAEMLAANKGLGYMILMGRTFAKVDIIIGGMLVIGVLGIVFTAAFDLLESRMLKWRMTK